MNNAIKEYTLPQVCIVLLALFLSILIPPLFPLRWIAGALLVFIVPGYAWLAAVGGGSELTGLWRTILSIGASISLDIICGLLLNLTPWGLSTDAWLIALGLLALLGSVIEAARLLRLRPFQRPAATGPSLLRAAMQAPVRHKALAVVAVILLVAAGVVANMSAGIPEATNEVVQFWMIPVSQQPASASPANVQERVTIGIHAIGGVAPTHYLVVVKADGNTISATGPITMRPGSTWQSTLGLQLPPNTLVEADLYRTDTPDQVFRSVWVWTPAHP